MSGKHITLLTKQKAEQLSGLFLNLMEIVISQSGILNVCSEHAAPRYNFLYSPL